MGTGADGCRVWVFWLREPGHGLLVDGDAGIRGAWPRVALIVVLLLLAVRPVGSVSGACTSLAGNKTEHLIA